MKLFAKLPDLRKLRVRKQAPATYGQKPIGFVNTVRETEHGLEAEITITDPEIKKNLMKGLTPYYSIDGEPFNTLGKPLHEAWGDEMWKAHVKEAFDGTTDASPGRSPRSLR